MAKSLTMTGTERVGFEPTELAFNGFQDRLLKPLGHLSTVEGARKTVGAGMPVGSLEPSI